MALEAAALRGCWHLQPPSATQCSFCYRVSSYYLRFYSRWQYWFSSLLACVCDLPPAPRRPGPAHCRRPAVPGSLEGPRIIAKQSGCLEIDQASIWIRCALQSLSRLQLWPTRSRCVPWRLPSSGLLSVTRTVHWACNFLHFRCPQPRIKSPFIACRFTCCRIARWNLNYKPLTLSPAPSMPLVLRSPCQFRRASRSAYMGEPGTKR